MQNTLMKSVLSITLALAMSSSFAQEPAPDVLLNAVTQEVIGIIKTDRDLQAGNPVKVAALIENKILPLFDFPRMTQIAMARNWRVASPGQQQALTAEFKTLLVHTYSNVLTTYRDQVFEFMPLHAAPGDTEVTVNSVVKQGDSPPLAIDYRMTRKETGWKVFDITVGGVSLVSIYRQTFAEKVRDDGVDGLIKSLEDKNRQGES